MGVVSEERPLVLVGSFLGLGRGFHFCPLTRDITVL
jgi:hypothetical protein